MDITEDPQLPSAPPELGVGDEGGEDAETIKDQLEKALDAENRKREKELQDFIDKFGNGL